jgi:hypothetical protein
VAELDEEGALCEAANEERLPVKWDLLLEWMTHMGSGRWGAFRDSVTELAGPEAVETQVLSRRLRIALADLGHVDFSAGSRRWQVMRPALLGMVGKNEHLFVGGRTRRLAESLKSMLREGGASVSITDLDPGLARISVVGTQDDLRKTAEALELEYVPEAAALLASRLPPLRQAIERAPARPEPINWAVRSWSFEDQAWISDRLPRTAREYTNRHGARRYMLHLGRPGLRELDKRVSIYGAAFLKNIRITRYSHVGKRLKVPRWAPLPEAYSRATCLAGGRLATAQEADLVFEAVEPHIASLLLVALGQGFPMRGDVI